MGNVCHCPTRARPVPPVPRGLVVTVLHCLAFGAPYGGFRGGHAPLKKSGTKLNLLVYAHSVDIRSNSYRVGRTGERIPWLKIGGCQ